jgi:response regulator NasT
MKTETTDKNMKLKENNGHAKTILVVDDNASVADMILKSLRRLGHVNVSIARSGEEALAVAERTKPDLVILDINMPDMDGIETARKITELQACSIIFSTGLWDKDTLQRSRKVSASSYLVKPFSPAQLQAAIQLAV